MVDSITSELPSRSPKYSCFISYRHADNATSGRQWASWLHQTLERHEIPPLLIDTLNEVGAPIPASLGYSDSVVAEKTESYLSSAGEVFQ